jgi:hypothetical protein
MELKFDKIRKTEVMMGGELVWQFSASAYVDGKPAGEVTATTGQDCQNRVDYALKNPDEYISRQMSSGNL